MLLCAAVALQFGRCLKKFRPPDENIECVGSISTASEGFGGQEDRRFSTFVWIESSTSIKLCQGFPLCRIFPDIKNQQVSFQSVET